MKKNFILCALFALNIPLMFSSCTDDDDDYDFTSSISGEINGYDYVDLGLSVKWATCNVGATSPNEYGDYYYWGGTMTLRNYSGDNCTTLTKFIESSIAGDAKYDVACKKWGSPWRLPTKDEMNELIDKCKIKWTTQDGSKGYKVTGPNGNSIFLPAAGFRHSTSLDNDGSNGYYWVATPYEDSSDFAYNLYFYKDRITMAYSTRSLGMSVRPVSN